MSVARSAYRHILSLISKSPQRVEDLDDICFALFGIILNRSDFAVAGYGSDLNAIVRNCFLRPTIPDDPRDSASSRLASSFVVLRKLHEVENSRAWQLARERRKGLLTRPNGEITDPGSAQSVPQAPSEIANTSQKEEKKERKEASAHRVLGAADETSNPAAGLEAVRRLAASKGFDARQFLATEATSANEDDNIVIGDATIFIERPKNHRVQKCSRHLVICRDRVRIPPYSYLLPPEPMYHTNIRHDFPFHFMNDAIICLAARSARLRDAAPAREGGRDKGGGALLKRPRSLAGLYQLLRGIPTHTILRTDFVEVEVGTQFVCSNRPGGETAAAAGEPEGEGPKPTPDGPPQHLFIYHVFIRVLGPQEGANPRRWHAQVMSQHLAVMDPARGAVVEMVRPGVVGNFPMLAPGESHAFESGTSIVGADAILRGTIQLNAFNEFGEMRTLDIAMAPTRLSVPMKKDGLSKEVAPTKQSAGATSEVSGVKTEPTTATR
ncbi:unnamed protein product [Phytomonas sp. Hart1]|nr:unnamed protein product [Phytomonas sp. Hart1]|eukprot:CCW70199.1 unnamed protein product [Phytomonas sp. isolate Hart1]